MCIGTDINELIAEKMKDENFKKQWHEFDTEFAFYRALIDARKESGLTQKELAAASGVAQSEISKIECGKKNVTIETLEKLAEGMGRQFVPLFVKKGEKPTI